MQVLWVWKGKLLQISPMWPLCHHLNGHSQFKRTCCPPGAHFQFNSIWQQCRSLTPRPSWNCESKHKQCDNRDICLIQTKMLNEIHSGWTNEAFLDLLFLSGKMRHLLTEDDWEEEYEPFDNGVSLFSKERNLWHWQKRRSQMYLESGRYLALILKTPI